MAPIRHQLFINLSRGNCKLVSLILLFLLQTGGQSYAGQELQVAQAGRQKAQKNPVVPGVTGAVIAPPMIIQPGNFNITQEEVTQSVNEVLRQAQISQKEDREYLLTGVERARVKLSQINSLIYKNLLDMSNQSAQSGSKEVTDKDFFKLIGQINGLVRDYSNEFTAITSLTSDALPSQNQVKINGAVQAVPKIAQINWDNVSKRFSASLNEMLDFANNLLMVIRFVDRQTTEIIARNSGTTLHPVFSFPILSQEQIDSIKNQIEEKRLVPREIVTAQMALANVKKTMIFNFVQRYGRDQKWRTRDDSNILVDQGRGDKVIVDGIRIPDYYKARDEAFEAIVYAFWISSYHRLKTGVTQGAIAPMPYKLQPLNLDVFQATEHLLQFRSELVKAEPDLLSAREDIRNYFMLVDARSTQIFGKESHPNWFVKASSLVTFLGGYRPMAETLFMIMQLVAGEIEEEFILRTKGMSAFKDFYYARYASSPENRLTYGKLSCLRDQTQRTNQECNTFLKKIGISAASRDTGGVSGGIWGLFNQLNIAYQSHMVRLNEAIRLESELSNLLASLPLTSESNERMNEMLR